MIIRLKTKNEIIWPLLILYILTTIINKPELLYVLLICSLIFVIGNIKKIVFPRIPGIYLFCLMIIIMVFNGLYHFSGRLVIRDFYYVSYIPLMIVVGYYLFYMYNGKKSIWKTIVLMTFIGSVIVLIQGMPTLIASSFAWNKLRELFAYNVDAAGVIASLLFWRRFILKEKTLGKWVDIIIIIELYVQALINLSRTTLLDIMIVFLGLMITTVVNDSIIKIKMLYKYITIFIMAISIYTCSLNILPPDVKEFYQNKIDNSFEEIDYNNDYNSVLSAQRDWRGFEIQSAKKQWDNYSTFEMLLGGGLGRMILLKYIPSYWGGMVEKQNGGRGPTLLHNSYYTYLIKGGIIMIIVLILFFILNFKLLFENINDDELLFFSISLIAILLVLLANSYFMKGLYGKSYYIGFFVLWGWVVAEINKKRKRMDK